MFIFGKKMKYHSQTIELDNLIKNKARYIFLRGSGGTGKSYTIGKFVEMHGSRHQDYVFVGPTGKSVAIAEEKGIQGATIHSFFEIRTNNTKEDITKFILKKFKSKEKYLTTMKLKLYNIKYFFIDEISMVNYDLLFHILQVLILKGRKDLTIVIAGDYHQLPPISEDVTNSKKLILELVQDEAIEFIDFITRYRSSNENYNQFLFDLRAGKQRNVNVICSYLENFFNIYRKRVPDEIKNKLTYLEYTNIKVQSINDEILANLPGKVHTFEYELITNKFPQEDPWRRNKIIDDMQMDNVLELKEGCKIIFRINSPEAQFKNGEEGIVQHIFSNSIQIKKMTNNAIINVSKYLFSSSEIDLKDGFEIESKQYPFSLGHARTIHKSQGDGFNHVHFNFDFLNSGALNTFKWHLLYTCLSRVKEPSEVWISEKSLRILKSQWYLLQDIKFNDLSLNLKGINTIENIYIKNK